jgi:hypothetical protein
MFCFDPEFCLENEYIRSFLEQKQQNESFRSLKNVDLTLLVLQGGCSGMEGGLKNATKLERTFFN